MKRLLLLLALLLVACPVGGTDDDDTTGDDDDTTGDDDDTTGDDDDTTGDDDDSGGEGCPIGIGGLSFCPSEAIESELIGSFDSWGPEEHPFTLQSGGSITIDVSISEAVQARLPDLSTLGTVSLVAEGGCDGKSGNYTTLAIRDADDPTDVLVVMGNVWTANLSGWSVDSPRDVTSCPVGVSEKDPACFCHASCHAKTVTFTSDAGTVAVGPASEEVLGDHTAIVWTAWSGQQLNCSDVGSEAQTWAVVRTDLLR